MKTRAKPGPKRGQTPLIRLLSPSHGTRGTKPAQVVRPRDTHLPCNLPFAPPNGCRWMSRTECVDVGDYLVRGHTFARVEKLSAWVGECAEDPVVVGGFVIHFARVN